MYSPKRIKITDVNPHLICVLCGGYYVDATTVIECLHSFCKSCIVKYLEKNKYCPICDVLVHKTSPLLNIRPDKTLQNVVYKLVPSLFKNEMQRRVEFYQTHPQSLPPEPEQRGEVSDNTPILFPDEQLIVCLEYESSQSSNQSNKRYLHCPAALTVSLLIKLIKGKFNLNSKHQVHMYFKDDLLQEHITLMDIAYTYQCRRKVPIHLTYKIFELKTKRIRIINPKRDPKEEKPEEKEWKEVQLQISENGVMSVRNVENSECSPIPAVEAPPVYSPSMISSSSNHYNATPASATENVTLEASRAPEQSTTINSDVNMDTDPVSTEPPPAKVESEIEKMESTNIRPPTPISSSSSADTIPPAVISVAARLTSGEVTVTPSLTSVTPVATAVVTTSSSVSTPSPTQSRPITTSQSLTVTSVASPRPDSVMSPSFSTTAPQGPSMVTTSGLTVSSPTWTESVTITTASLPQTVSSVPLTTVSLASYTVPSLPPPVSIPHVLVGANTIPSSTALETCIVTTMAGMKPQTNLVPSNFPIMSTCRPQTEPIVSVSKVSKDQVRKPNNVIEANKLSISRVPPGGMKEKGENLNKIVNKLSPNERVIGNTSVTIRPVINSSVNSPNPPKMFPITRPPGLQSPPASVSKERQPQMKYKTLKSPTKQWNPSIDRATMLMKQNTDQSKPARFFKMRNMPRFLGNPSSGVKPMYACPEEPSPNQVKQKLTLMKVDPKSIPTSSIPRSPTKQPPPYTPGSPKMSKPPPAYPDPKPTYLNPSRMPSPAHAGNFLPPNPYHLLYNSYPGFSHEANRMISPELIRSMCAYHPSLPPSIGMLFNPNIHPAMPRPQENYKSEPPTPAVQRIPPSKTETPPPKQIEEKRFPSPVGLPEIKKSTPTPPPISSSPKEVEKPPGPPPSPAPATQEANLKSPVPSEPSQSLPAAEEKQNNLDTPHEKNSLEESDVMKINCDAINVNNNNSKESPPSQPSEGLTPKP